MKQSKNYLITGATGFIGKNLLDKIKKKIGKFTTYIEVKN